MSCHSCNSDKARDYTAEINIHFPGWKGFDIPTVWVFPAILVCMDCGEARFTIPEAERKALAAGDYRHRADKAAVKRLPPAGRIA